MKYKIEKNTVQETLILPLYSRKLCTELYPNLYRDETAVRLLDQIDYDFSGAEKSSRSLMRRFGALEVAMRQNDLAFEVRECVTLKQVLILSTCSIRNTFSIVFLPAGIAAITGTCTFRREFFAAALAD